MAGARQLAASFIRSGSSEVRFGSRERAASRLAAGVIAVDDPGRRQAGLRQHPEQKPLALQTGQARGERSQDEKTRARTSQPVARSLNSELQKRFA